MVERVGREILGVGNKKAARKNKEVEEVEEGCSSFFSENGNVYFAPWAVDRPTETYSLTSCPLMM
ncbi:hypothetical protein TYRP_003170 [Tyrophagus putrescentiae]|nr:hypothetical protein TYRP_003170 [Tyrophagus putrescentiae]